jgi:hypothetical protein
VASVSKRGRYWRAQIVRRGYPPQYRTFDTRAEAEAWSRAMESEMDRGIFVSRVESEKTTLADALGRYEREISVGKAHPEQDYQRIRHWLRQDLAHYLLANLREADFAQYRDDRRAMGRAANTVRLALALVSHLFEIARKEWGMEGLMNPLKNISPSSRATACCCARPALPRNGGTTHSRRRPRPNRSAGVGRAAAAVQAPEGRRQHGSAARRIDSFAVSSLSFARKIRPLLRWRRRWGSDVRADTATCPSPVVRRP